MPPPTKTGKPETAWWLKENAYTNCDYISVVYELEFGKDVIKPGDMIKIKNMRGTYRFRCVAHNIPMDVTWIDCMDMENGAWCSFRIEKIKCLVKPKKSRRKKPNA